MLHEHLVTEVIVIIVYGVHHVGMVLPYFCQIFVICKYVQTNSLICLPVSLKQARNKDIIQSFMNEHMQLTVFTVGDFDGMPAQLFPSLIYERFQFLNIGIG